MKLMPPAVAMALALATVPEPAVRAQQAVRQHPDPATVSRLIDDTTKDSKTQARAISTLVDMGEAAVPALVPHLDDGRLLAEKSIILPNRPWRIHDRQFQPWTVHDAVIIVLREVAPQGPAIGSGNPHTVDPGQRARVKRTWVNWCVGHFPTQAGACRSQP